MSGFAVVVVTFFDEILEDVHDFFLECVSVPKTIKPFLGVPPFFKGKMTIFIVRETKHTFYRRKSTNIFLAKAIPSYENFVSRPTVTRVTFDLPECQN